MIEKSIFLSPLSRLPPIHSTHHFLPSKNTLRCISNTHFYSQLSSLPLSFTAPWPSRACPTVTFTPSLLSSSAISLSTFERVFGHSPNGLLPMVHPISILCPHSPQEHRYHPLLPELPTPPITMWSKDSSKAYLIMTPAPNLMAPSHPRYPEMHPGWVKCIEGSLLFSKPKKKKKRPPRIDPPLIPNHSLLSHLIDPRPVLLWKVRLLSQRHSEFPVRWDWWLMLIEIDDVELVAEI